MASIRNPFHAADYVIFVVTILVSLGIGLYYAISGGRQKTTAEYLVGNRQMKVIPVAVSLMVTFESSIMMLGSPAEAYIYGLQIMIGLVFFTIAYMLTIPMVVPLVFPLKITSTYEYLELRFNSHAVRLLGTMIGICYYVAYMGIVLFGPAIALEAVIGFPLWVSIVVVAVVAIVYTSIGGLKAVIWTDVFQCVIMFCGVFAILIKATLLSGGVRKTWDIAYNAGRINMFNFDTDPTVRHTFWCLSFNGMLRGFGFVFNQSTIQRIGATPTERAAKRALYATSPAFLITIVLASIEGVVAYSFFHTLRCDPLEAQQIRDPNQIIPYTVLVMFRDQPGMMGIFMASLFSASLSTLSSGLSSVSALTWTDIIQPHIKPVSEFKATVIAKAAVVGFGGVAVLIAFLISMIGGTLVQITVSILSAFSGPLAGLFMLAALTPWANAKGSFIGTVLGIALSFWVSIGQMTTPGSVRDTALPPAPSDHCPALNRTHGDLWPGFNTTLGLVSGNYTGYTASAAPDVAMETEPQLEGISKMYTMSYQFINPVGIFTTLVVGTIISLLTGGNRKTGVDPRYLIPLFDRLMPYLPRGVRRFLHCGVDFTETEKFRKANSDHRMTTFSYDVVVNDGAQEDNNLTEKTS